MNRTRIATLAATAAGLVLVAGTADAGIRAADTTDPDNRYTWGEVNDTSAGQAKGNAEGQYGCVCHGTRIREWFGADGHRRFEVLYPDTDENSVFITYRYDEFGTPRVASAVFATDGEGYGVRLAS